MYSFPSTSVRRAPRPFSKKSGTGALARNGLLTPPAKDPRALSSIRRDRSHVVITDWLLVRCEHCNRDRVSQALSWYSDGSRVDTCADENTMSSRDGHGAVAL